MTAYNYQNSLSLKYIKNGLYLNGSKCKRITFLRNKHCISFHNIILEETLPKFISINDQSNLLFTNRIGNICMKTLKTQSFELKMY